MNTQKGLFALPEGYTLTRTVDFQKDKRLAVIVNLLALVITAALIAPAMLLKPPVIPAEPDELIPFLIVSLCLLAALIGYLFAHEFVHGIFIKKYSGKRARYGFTGLYAYAASDAYFNKRQYLVIALAPVVVFGVLFLALNLLLPAWFWFFYVLQVINLSGAAGDIFITALMLRLPDDVLTTDEGVSMLIYVRTTADERGA